MSSENGRAALTEQKYQLLKSNFFKKGVLIGGLSGLLYGVYSAFLTLGMARGVWADWYGANTAGLSAFVIAYLLSALGTSINDAVSGVWSLLQAAIKGKLKDFARTMRTKPGWIMVLAALFGGPIANTAYVIGLQMAGSLAAPISALCVALGAILGRVLYKQKLTPRMIGGIVLCFVATVMIGGNALADVNPQAALGCAISFIAALGWGIEGCVAGYGTSMIDYEIGITIRQCTSGIVNTLVVVPLFAILAGNIGLAPHLLGQAWTSAPAMVFFLISGFCAMLTYSFWYKGNAMCGAALGMALNGTYSFFTPLCCWILLGLICQEPGWALTALEWAGAIVMFFGILLIALNPLTLFKKKGQKTAASGAAA